MERSVNHKNKVDWEGKIYLTLIYFPHLMWKIAGKHNETGEQRPENNNIRKVWCLSSETEPVYRSTWDFQVSFSPCFYSKTRHYRESSAGLSMMLCSASWLILSSHILASYSDSAIQNVLKSRSPRKERIYFPGQLESFAQSDLEDRNVRLARLGTIPAEPPQG